LPITSIPSVNLTPWISFGNWLWPSMRRQIFLRAFDKLEDHGKRGLVRQAAF
jgi:hypothetical protein